MKLLILHLSDIHFSLERSFVLSRIDKIIAAATNVDISCSRLLIVLSGDIASKGSAAEYAIALQFVDQLKSRFRSVVSTSLPIDIIATAGNHDLDFSTVGEDVVDVLTTDIVRSGKEPSKSAGVFKTLLTAQAEFFKFQQQVSGRSSTELADRFLEATTLKIGEEGVTLTGLNTAVLSRRHEVQGMLWFPMEILDRPHETPSPNSYSILVYHHPDKWLESNNAVRFRGFTEAFADLVLMGHQHTPDSFYSESLTGDTTWYSAGDALQGSSEQKSGFSVLCIDLSQRTRRRVAYSWSSDFYLATHDTGWKSFRSNATARAGYVVSDKFNDILDNPGNLITHQFKKKVYLRDVYEPCRLRRRNGNLSKISSVIQAGNVPDLVSENSPVLIFGDAQSGKTVLGKHLFRQMLSLSGSDVPVLLNGADLRGSAEKNVDRWVRKAFQSQYTLPTFSKFKGLARESRILIVDDWQNLALNDLGKAVALEHMERWAARIILIADSWYQLQELASTKDDNAYSSTFLTLNILPYAPWQQTNMIERWVSLGREEVLNRDERIYEIDKAEKHLDELTATGLLPKYPLHILTALQTFQAFEDSQPDMGAQGHLYDTLVDRALDAMSEDAAGIDINRHFIALLAGAVFENNRAPLSIERIQEIADDYLRTHANRVEVKPLLELLVDYRLLRVEDGAYCFREKYIYYYFVAELFAFQLSRRSHKDRALARLKEMAQYLAYEDYSQILMFVIYKNQNEDLIEEIIFNSEMILEGIRPCDLDKDVSFINALNITRPEVSLPSDNVEENRMEQRKSLGDETTEIYGRDSSHTKYSPDLDEASKLQHAFKAMQMMGRIIRNFPGGLEAETKLNLALSTYDLGMRTLTKLFDA